MGLKGAESSGDNCPTQSFREPHPGFMLLHLSLAFWSSLYSAKERRLRIVLGSFYRPDLRGAHTHSGHIPLASTPSQGDPSPKGHWEMQSNCVSEEAGEGWQEGVSGIHGNCRSLLQTLCRAQQYDKKIRNNPSCQNFVGKIFLMGNREILCQHDLSHPTALA